MLATTLWRTCPSFRAPDFPDEMLLYMCNDFNLALYIYELDGGGSYLYDYLLRTPNAKLRFNATANPKQFYIVEGGKCNEDEVVFSMLCIKKDFNGKYFFTNSSKTEILLTCPENSIVSADNVCQFCSVDQVVKEINGVP